MDDEGPRRGRGRPRAATREEVQETAVELFLAQGYATTTMEQVAEAAGVGRTTLFRYFAGKPALVWWDFEANYARLDEALGSAEGSSAGSSPVVAEVRDAVRSALVGIGTTSTLMQRRWELIDHDPTVAAELAVQMLRWAQRVADHVRGAVDGLPSAVADAVGYAVLGATVGATRTWSDDGRDRALVDVLDDVLDPLATALQTMVDSAVRPSG